MEYEAIIGLEVHIELATKSKMFCGCSANSFGKEPNTLTCPVCLGLPGALPVPNHKAVEWTILLGLALESQISLQSKFDRKNYFYPDLPKGYQISQYDEPVAVNGEVRIKNQELGEKKIRIRRVHLEEDTGKLLHSSQIAGYDGPANVSLVDFNRSGVPLVEIVTEPDFRSSNEAKEFLKKVQLLVRYLNISDADMEKGSLRIEPSISLREINHKSQIANDKSQGLPRYRVEIKNINSFRFAQKAIDYEIKRQTEILERGEEVPQETRGWSESKAITLGQRTKEEAHDYRYFPEPDIPPMVFTPEQVEVVRRQLPELPDQRIDRYKAMGVREAEAEIIASDLRTANYFDELFPLASDRKISLSSLATILVNKKVDIEAQTPLQLIEAVIHRSSLETMDEAAIRRICQKVIVDHPQALKKINSGKEAAIQFLVGQVMKESKGQANALKVTQILTNLIRGN